MKINWKNICDLKYNKNKGCWYKKRNKRYIEFLYADTCKTCDESFLYDKGSKGFYCCQECVKSSKEVKQKISKGNKGKKRSEEYKKEQSKRMEGKNNSMWGKKQSDETKQKISQSLMGRIGKNCSSYKGNYTSKNIPLYDTYAHQISLYEEVRRDTRDKNVLQVKCVYCEKWYTPKITDVVNRIQVLKGNYSGECKLYCSNECKQNCPLYNKYKISKPEIELQKYLKCNSQIKVGKYKFDLGKENKLIEFNGDYYHLNPEIYEADYYNKKTKITAQEKWNYDKKKLDYAKSKGYDVLTIWEKDFNQNKQEVIKECINFIK